MAKFTFSDSQRGTQLSRQLCDCPRPIRTRAIHVSHGGMAQSSRKPSVSGVNAPSKSDSCQLVSSSACGRLACCNQESCPLFGQHSKFTAGAESGCQSPSGKATSPVRATEAWLDIFLYGNMIEAYAACADYSRCIQRHRRAPSATDCRVACAARGPGSRNAGRNVGASAAGCLEAPWRAAQGRRGRGDQTRQTTRVQPGSGEAENRA